MKQRLAFATEGLTWSAERLYSQVFSDEVWAHRGSNSRRYVIVFVGGDKSEVLFDRYRSECLARRYSKLPAWLFYDLTHDGKKELGIYWEKEYGTMDLRGYDEHILSQAQMFFDSERASGQSPVFQHDNAPCHKSRLTKENLERREILTIPWFPYSTDLNLIEHVWSRMKQHVQEHHLLIGYDPQTIELQYLRQIIQEAWEAVPDEYIIELYESLWDRCEAVINARRGPTKY